MGKQLLGDGLGKDEADVGEDFPAFEVGFGGIWDVNLPSNAMVPRLTTDVASILI